MSEQPDDLRICPNCGQENASHTMRCIRCGQELEGLFELEGFETTGYSDGENSENIPTPTAEILASLDESPLLSDLDEGKADQEIQTEFTENEPGGDKGSPDWLERIRQRAKEEEDAAGELAKGAIAMDDRRSQEGRKQVDEAFDEIMRRIREQNEREKVHRTRRVESDLVDENGDPEWLRRIRELRPDREDDSQANIISSGLKASSDDEWTEEELQELLRHELGLPEKADEEPEEEITTEVSTPSSIEEDVEIIPTFPTDEIIQGQPAQAEPEPEFLHNIPDEEEDFNGGIQNDLPSEMTEAAGLSEELNQTEDDLPLETDSDPESEQLDVESEADSNEEVSEAESEIQPTTDEPISTKETLPDLLLLKNQRERAQVFSEILGQEGHRTIPVLHERNRQSKFGRFALGMLLVLGVLLAILVGPSGTVNLPLSAPAAAFAKNLESVGPGDSILIILDYQAATRNDIEPLAKRALEILDEKGSSVRVVTSNPENIWLAGNLSETGQIPDQFIPGGMLGYLALAVGDSPDWGELPINHVFSGDPGLFSEVDQIVLISDSAEFVRMWLEQISPWQPEIETSAITTAVSSAILLPYHDSGQLKGFVAGIIDAKALDVEPQNMINQRAFQVGTLLMIVVLLLGMIMKADEDAQRRVEERKQ